MGKSFKVQNSEKKLRDFLSGKRISDVYHYPLSGGLHLVLEDRTELLIYAHRDRLSIHGIEED